MRTKVLRWSNRVGFAVALATLGCCSMLADEIQMQNGDRYLGKVLSLNNDTLLLQSDVLGTVRLPRAKVTLISLGAPLPAASSGPALPAVQGRAIPGTATNSNAALAHQLSANPGVLQQIQSQYLSDATPETKDKFNELLGGLMSGKLNVADIRAQAQSTAAQVRAMRKDLGEDAGWMLDTYLAILDNFVKETAPAAAPAGRPPVSKATKPNPDTETE